MKKRQTTLRRGQFGIQKPAAQSDQDKMDNVGWAWCYRTDRHLYGVTFVEGCRTYLRNGRRCNRTKGHDLVIGHYDLPTGYVPKDIAAGNAPRPRLEKIASIRGPSPRILFALDNETDRTKAVVHCVTIETFEFQRIADFDAMCFVDLAPEVDPRIDYLADCFKLRDGSWKGPIGRGTKR